jgi:hypothetical protein
MSDEAVQVERKSVGRRVATIAIEIVLVVIIIGLLIATWLPALIGANPDAPRTP